MVRIPLYQAVVLLEPHWGISWVHSSRLRPAPTQARNKGNDAEQDADEDVASEQPDDDWAVFLDKRI